MSERAETLAPPEPATRSSSGPTVLLVDDHVDFRDSLGLLVAREGFTVREAGSLAEARRELDRAPADVVIVDLTLPDGNGIELLTTVAEEGARPEFIVVTGNATVDSAVAAMREGVLDYLTKPIDHARLKAILGHVQRARELKSQVRMLQGELREMGRFGRMVGRSAKMQAVYDLIARVAPTDATVFVTGESGTGKELVAETLHHLSSRRDGPFMAVNCGAIPKDLIESELFGHEKGSFTGAERARRGHFEEADKGVLFLDEVSELPFELQVKLLRALETGTVMRVGSSEPLALDVRVIAASNRDPLKAVREGALREDLYYRLNVFPIPLPALREREDDVLLLADHLLAEINRREGSNKRWASAARERLRAYSWPGNVRELRNAVERAFILADEKLEPDLLPLPAAVPVETRGDETALRIPIGSSLDAAERRLILATLQQFNGDKKRAAETLGISLKTLYNRLNVYAAGPAPDAAETL
jgi:DNA-binding NtrC family response regulator